MMHEYFWTSGMWIFPIFGIIMMVFVIYLVFGRGNQRSTWCGPGQNNDIAEKSESALDILKKRYAKGEITKDEFEHIKKDIL